MNSSLRALRGMTLRKSLVVVRSELSSLASASSASASASASENLNPSDISNNSSTNKFSIKGMAIEGRPSYLDAQATTPMDPRVLDAMVYFIILSLCEIV